jgi:hypothetical protein
VKLLKRLVSQKNDFITAAELQQALSLQATIDQLAGHASQLRMESRDEAFKSAISAYTALPSDETLAALRRVFVDFHPFGGFPNSQDPVSKVVIGLRNGFLTGAVISWAKPLWLRSMDLLRGYFLEANEREEARVFSETGAPMTFSDVVASVAAEVSQWAEMGRRAGFISDAEAKVITLAGARIPQLRPVSFLEKQLFERYGVDVAFVSGAESAGTCKAPLTPFEWLRLLGNEPSEIIPAV